MPDNHVIPMEDYRPHEVSMECWCRPTRDIIYEEVVIHHALDGREQYESGELKLQ